MHEKPAGGGEGGSAHRVLETRPWMPVVQSGTCPHACTPCILLWKKTTTGTSPYTEPKKTQFRGRLNPFLRGTPAGSAGEGRTLVAMMTSSRQPLSFIHLPTITSLSPLQSGFMGTGYISAVSMKLPPCSACHHFADRSTPALLAPSRFCREQFILTTVELIQTSKRTCSQTFALLSALSDVSYKAES